MAQPATTIRRTTKGILRAVIYCRISVDVLGEGLGVQRQESECRRILEQMGWILVDVFVDNDISAYSGKPRPGFIRMCEMINDGLVDAIICWAPDRLTRHPRELEDLIDMLEHHSITVSTAIAGVYDLTTPGGRLIARQLGGIARYESELKSARIKNKFRQSALAGEPPPGRPPYGYMRVDRKYAINIDEAKIIKWVIEKITDGMPLQGIGSLLDEMKIPTRKGGRWHATRVRAIVINPALVAMRLMESNREDPRDTWNMTPDTDRPGNWEPLLERDVWDNVRATLTNPSRRHFRPRGNYMFTGYLRSEAGVSLIGRVELGRKANPTRSRRTYTTPQGSEGKSVVIDATKVEEFLWELVLMRFDHATVEGSTADVTALKAERAAQKAKRLALAQRHQRNEIDEDEWEVFREPLRERIAQLDAEINMASRNTPAILLTPGALRKKWPTPPTDAVEIRDVRRLLGTVLDHVVISNAQHLGRYWNEDEFNKRIGVPQYLC